MLLSSFQVIINYKMELLPSESCLLAYTFWIEKDGVKRCWQQGKEASRARWYLSSPIPFLLPEPGSSVLFPKEREQAKCPSPLTQPTVHFSNLQYGRGRTHSYINCSRFHSRVEEKVNSKGWVHFTAIVSSRELMKHSFFYYLPYQ